MRVHFHCTRNVFPWHEGDWVDRPTGAVSLLGLEQFSEQDCNKNEAPCKPQSLGGGEAGRNAACVLSCPQASVLNACCAGNLEGDKGSPLTPP